MKRFGSPICLGWRPRFLFPSTILFQFCLFSTVLSSHFTAKSRRPYGWTLAVSHRVNWALNPENGFSRASTHTRPKSATLRLVTFTLDFILASIDSPHGVADDPRWRNFRQHRTTMWLSAVVFHEISFIFLVVLQFDADTGCVGDQFRFLCRGISTTASVRITICFCTLCG